MRRTHPLAAIRDNHIIVHPAGFSLPSSLPSSADRKATMSTTAWNSARVFAREQLKIEPAAAWSDVDHLPNVREVRYGRPRAFLVTL